MNVDAERRNAMPARFHIQKVDLYMGHMLPVLLLILFGTQFAGQESWLNALSGTITQPTRYEEGPQLVAQRWNNLVTETWVAAIMAALSSAAIFAFSRKWISVAVLPFMLLLTYLVDVERVNAKFMFLVDAPQTSKVAASNDALEACAITSPGFNFT